MLPLKYMKDLLFMKSLQDNRHFVVKQQEIGGQFRRIHVSASMRTLRQESILQMVIAPEKT